MRYGGNNQFDTSDSLAPIDRLDAVLDIAAEVLIDHGSCEGMTRIERLARYITTHLGGEPYAAEIAGTIAKFMTTTTWCSTQAESAAAERILVWRIGSLIALESPEGNHTRLDIDQARSVAVMLLRASELAEH